MIKQTNKSHPPIRLVALDLDGTLMNSESRITEHTLDVIRRVMDKGVEVVISTGRPFSGVPLKQLESTPMNYALTTNGAAIWKFTPRQCIYKDTMPDELAFEILNYLFTKNAHVAMFMGEDGISPERCYSMIPNLVVTDSIKHTLSTTRVHVPDPIGYMKEHDLHLQKATLNFMRDANGHLLDRDEIERVLQSDDRITVVSGGFHNLEFTKRGVDKGVGLHALAAHLGIEPEATMAIGDTENDLAILRAAGISVAMGNAIDSVKAEADYITIGHDEDGVAHALEYFFL